MLSPRTTLLHLAAALLARPHAAVAASVMAEFADTLGLITAVCETPELLGQCNAFAQYELAQCSAGDMNCALAKLAVVDEYCQAVCAPTADISMADKLGSTLYNTSSSAVQFVDDDEAAMYNGSVFKGL